MDTDPHDLTHDRSNAWGNRSFTDVVKCSKRQNHYYMSEDDDEKFEGVDELFQANMHCDDNIPPLAFA